MKKANFIFIPNKLISCDWLERNGLNHRALFLWCHLWLYHSFYDSSWFSLKELYEEIGIKRTTKKNPAWDDLLMTLTRFQTEGFIDFDGNLSDLDFKDHLTVKLNESFFSQKSNFTLMESEKFYKLLNVKCDFEKDVVLKVYAFVISHLLNGRFAYGINRTAEELHLRNTKVSEILNFLTENDFLESRCVTNPQTGRPQTIYSPKK